MKVAVGGFQHETNVFAPHKADYAAFARRDEWPPLGVGANMLDNVLGVHLPVSGAVARLKELGHEVAPLLWCSAMPCAHVCEDAFERIAAMLLRELQNALPVGGVLLDLHGAMVCEHLPDGDGELLRRVREMVGGDVPVVASLDLHANVSDLMAEQASALDIYRTYPHIDMADTGARAAGHLDALMRNGLARFPASALRRADFLIPLNWGCTLSDPAKSIYEFLGAQAGSVSGLSMACGFPHSDVADAPPAVCAHGFERKAVEAAADGVINEVRRRKAEFRGAVHGIEDGIDEALRLLKSARKKGPVLLADTQDNPGGGGPCDTTEILRALVARRAPDALAGLISDPQAAERAHAAGVGAHIDIALGGKSGFPGSEPFAARFRVLHLSEGSFPATGPMLAGADIDLGPMALLETGGVRAAVSSKPAQAMDRSMFLHAGADPAAMKIVALKSSVHFRNDFEEIAAAILIVAAPGPVTADLAELPFQNARLRKITGRA